jgi:hypothetical protein
MNPWLEKIVRANFFISSITEMELPIEKGMALPDARWESFFENITEWYNTANDPTLAPLLKSVEGLKTAYYKGLTHQDFAPWHMIDNGNNFVLIDGEHARLSSLRYYDTAHFYHRVYTTANSPEVAKKFLSKIRELTPENRKGTFDSEFLPTLASRIIGGFYELKISKEKYDDHYHKKLRDDFLSGNLYE